MTEIEDKKFNISCIIAAYNEESRINRVLDVVIGHKLLDEVIVVNDGSTDKTESLLQAKSGLKLISYPKNRGKTHAIMVGLKEARNNLVLLIDADLANLNQSNITALIEPVINNQADVTLSTRANSLFIFKWLGLDYVSGERAFNKEIIGDFNKLDELPRYGFESFMNEAIIQKKLRIKVVNWPNVIHTIKAAKIGFWAGWISEFKMLFQIISLMSLTGMVSQFWNMLKLKVPDA
jgi:glycosyltransferase involved in cell wall biosynthesis